MKNAELQAVPHRCATVRVITYERSPPFPVTVSYHKGAGSVSVQNGPSEKSFSFLPDGMDIDRVFRHPDFLEGFLVPAFDGSLSDAQGIADLFPGEILDIPVQKE